MSFREQITRLRRDHRTESSRLDKKIDSLNARVDADLGAIQQNFSRIDQNFSQVQEQLSQTQEHLRKVQLQLLANQDELGATNESLGSLRANYQEMGRTLQGRSRLLEDRFGKMLELVEEALPEVPISILWCIGWKRWRSAGMRPSWERPQKWFDWLPAWACPEHPGELPASSRGLT